MQFGHLELLCADTLRTRDFFVAGLGFEETAEQPGGFIWLKSGPVEVLLRPGNPPTDRPEYQSSSSAIVLYCTDLEATLAELKSRGIEPTGNDGEGCPTFQDPDGRWIQIVENASA